MTPYEAVLETARLFEQKPELFYFQEIYVPKRGTPGSALGYIGYFLGHSGRIDGINIVGVENDEFYSRISSLLPGRTRPWTRNADLCAAALRLYAEKYLSEEAP